MKKLYWRPQQLSVRLLVLIAVIGGLALGAVEHFKVLEKQRYYREKRAAARLALRGFEAVKAARRKRRVPIDSEVDPARSGLVGRLISSITTNTGHLPAKQTSVNPNFAAAIADMLLRAEVKAGDVVALGISGSFPALNICALAAVETLKLKPVIIASAGASQWGANYPRLTWPDMEKILFDEHIIRHRSVAVSLGGVDDRALGMSEAGKRKITKAIERNGYHFLEVKSYDDSLEKRMALYREQAGDADIKAYINVGGGTTSVGTKVGRDLFRPGLNRRVPRGPQIDAVMRRFAEQGVPVVHMSHIAKLAERYGFPAMPTSIPRVGEGKIFSRVGYNRWLAGGALLLLIALLFGFLRLDWGHRLLTSKGGEQKTSRPEPMV